jgi:hypothetical protein
MNNENKQTIDEMIENIDFNALLKRRLGSELTEEEKTQCSDFDELFAAVAPSMMEDMDDEG